MKKSLLDNTHEISGQNPELIKTVTSTNIYRKSSQDDLENLATILPGKRLSQSDITLRFQLQSLARKLLEYSYENNLLNKHGRVRISGCQRWRSLTATNASIYRNHENKLRYGGLYSCGSVWDCAYCAPIISHYRADVLKAAIDHYMRDGGIPAMLTVTLRHNAINTLDNVLGAITVAWSKLRQQRAFKSLLEASGIEGYIRSTEVTVGVFGWHPHFHVILLSKQKITARFKRDFTQLWRRELSKLGFSATIDGVDLSTGNRDVAEYVAKYGRLPVVDMDQLSAEIAKPIFKTARAGNSNPTELLISAYGGNLKAALLWLEYSDCFWGARQLVYSNSAKTLLNLEDIKDAKIIEAEEKRIIKIVAELSDFEWDLILSRAARGSLLDMLESLEDELIPAALKSWIGSYVVLDLGKYTVTLESGEVIDVEGYNRRYEQLLAYTGVTDGI